MSNSIPMPDVGDLNLSDSDPDALFDSPDTRRAKKQAKAASTNPSNADDTSNDKGRTPESRYSAAETREATLRTELDSVRNINRVVEDMVSSLQKAKSNMSTVNNTVNQSTTLLQTWTRILSQTEHNQRLILNPNWQGASQDLADIENEERQRQAAAERREAEEQARKAEAARRAEEEERRRAVAAQGGSKARGTAHRVPQGMWVLEGRVEEVQVEDRLLGERVGVE
ncbi:hypothetical protein NA57DRAFT_77220 [Rhizodiscina lignyota]|uniref:DASH complex subunit DUO1 n=1 Tax=Rhizodiscina lignyota TaxID=1504668 RepID=A0A9P4M4M6_9PEZI|nr:hypothetical protein NA57DRAFT_77220 [Rhizodiscina lignyota]